MERGIRIRVGRDTDGLNEGESGKIIWEEETQESNIEEKGKRDVWMKQEERNIERKEAEHWKDGEARKDGKGRKDETIEHNEKVSTMTMEMIRRASDSSILGTVGLSDVLKRTLHLPIFSFIPTFLPLPSFILHSFITFHPSFLPSFLPSVL
jgi:hypothetical protein